MAKMDQQAALAMHAEGRTDGEIARHFDVNQSYVTRWRNKRSLRPNAPPSEAMTADTLRKARQLLREGRTRKQVASALNCSLNAVQRIRDDLRDDPRLRGTGQTIASARRTIDRHAGDIMSELANVTRHMTDQTLRDDVIAEMAMALLEGRLTRDRVKAEARKYCGRAYQQWQNRWGAVSIDDPSNDEGFTLADIISCPSAAVWLEQVGA